MGNFKMSENIKNIFEEKITESALNVDSLKTQILNSELPQNLKQDLMKNFNAAISCLYAAALTLEEYLEYEKVHDLKV